jgi:hypothetical protein
MMELYILLAVSVGINICLIWYISKLLRKFVFISENMADLFLTNKAFEAFLKSMYSMDNYHGEPMVQELMLRIQEVLAEMEDFRDIFEYGLDAELEEELNATQEEN